MSSKIKVDTIENVAGSGNVSLGSGHNLVVPGNITGSGDLTIDTNTLIVDASANSVGIGATPDSNRDLHIKRTGANASILIEETSATNFGQFIELKDSATSWFIANRYANTGSGQSGFGIGTTNSGDMLQIDTSGRILMGSQPSFRAGMTANQTVAQNAVVTYQTTDHNIGNHFDTSSNVGRFTAPVAGRYLFGIAMGDGNNSGIAGIFALCKNGSRYYDFLEGGAPSGISGHYEKHASVVVNAAANDYFDIRQISSGNKNLEGTADGLSTRNRFWGHLLG